MVTGVNKLLVQLILSHDQLRLWLAQRFSAPDHQEPTTNIGVVVPDRSLCKKEARKLQ